MKTTQFKKLAVAVTGVLSLAGLLLMPAPAQMATEDQATEVATTYKTKCFACHGAKAEKKFDATMAEDQMVDTILKGKKVEKPPNMPAFAEKGITADQAKALIAYMKSLKQ